MTSTYGLYRERDDETLVTMLLVADDQEESLAEAEAEDTARAERLRTLLEQARSTQYTNDAQWTDANTDTEDEQYELEDDQSAPEEEGDLLMAENGQVLHGTYRFMASVWGSLQLKDQSDGHIAWVPDTWDVPLGSTGWIVIDGGVADEPQIDPPPPPEPEPQQVDTAAILWNNVQILNAMFVDGAGDSQRTARVLTDGVLWILKNIHDQSGDDRLSAGFGTGTVRFTRNRMSPNEITVSDDGGLDADRVRAEIKDLLDREMVDYPYRDRTRVKFR